MAIKEVQRKIHFRPYVPTKGRIVDTEPAPTVVVSKKYNTILFSKATVQACNMSGKFVKLFYEPTKKIIGWQIRDKEMGIEESKNWKLCVPLKSGAWSVGVKKLLSEFSGLNKDSYPNLPVQKYREMGPLDQYSGQTFYFVEVKSNEIKNEN